MFFRLLRYSLIKTIRSKEILFWNLLFPIALGTLFYVSFGSYMDKQEIFKEIPVAYVEEKADDEEGFQSVLDALEDQDDPLVTVTDTSFDKAKKLLEDEKVIGIYYNVGADLKLYVKDEGIKQSILESILNQYQQTASTVKTISKTHPELIQKVVESSLEQVDMLEDEKYTDSDMNPMVTYFYALIAMSCLYGCFMGVRCATDIKADITPLGARRLIASTNRFFVLEADILSSLVLQFLCGMIGFVYLKYVLNINFGSKVPYLVLVILVGSFIGIATGFFIGSLGKASKDTKMGISVAITMAECFLSGLMVNNMYYQIQEYCPIVNKINPAALMVDAMYSLDVYPTYERYTTNVILLLVIAVVLCIGSFLLVRRERYASL